PPRAPAGLLPSATGGPPAPPQSPPRRSRRGRPPRTARASWRVLPPVPVAAAAGPRDPVAAHDHTVVMRTVAQVAPETLEPTHDSCSRSRVAFRIASTTGRRRTRR